MTPLTTTLLLLLLFAVTTLQLDVPNCHARKNYILNFTLINGTLDTTTHADLCHDNQHLFIRWHSTDDDIIAPYQKCNDPLYNADAVEIFIATS